MRGDPYRLRAPRDARGHEQQGRRCAVVLQVPELDPLSTWVVAPTSTSAPERSFRPTVELDGVATRVVVDQMTPVDREGRLGEFAGRLSPGEWLAVERAVRVVLGL